MKRMIIGGGFAGTTTKPQSHAMRFDRVEDVLPRTGRDEIARHLEVAAGFDPQTPTARPSPGAML